MAVVGGLGLAAGTTSAILGGGEITSALKIHKESFQQDKRLFYADYAEAIAHHGEAYAQAERLHSQSFAQGEAAYYQADRHHRRSFQQARLQHQVDRDIVMRAEIRNGLRDEFGQKNNRYNALMICQTVMLTSAFMLTLTELPTDSGKTDKKWESYSWAYSALLGLALGVLSLSLWFNFVVTRRLNQYTAGVMHVEMHLDETWRKRRGVDDVADAALVRDYFRRWFQHHCGLHATISMYGFMVGLFLLFFGFSVLLHVRFELQNRVKKAGSPFFFILCGATVIIVGLEVRERSLTKKKEGVYARPWVNKLTSSLRDQMNALKKFESQPLAAQGLQGDNSSEEHGAMRAGTEETVARRHCPEAVTVARTASRCAAAAKTEQLLEKSWRQFQENQQKEKDTKREDWERDDWMSDILTEVQLLSRARQASLSHSEAQASYGRRVGVSGDDVANTSGEDEDELLSAEELASSQSMVSIGKSSKGLTRKINGPASLAPSNISRTPSQVTAVVEIDATQLRKKLGVYFRSTMVHITNATDVKLHLKIRRLVSGSWFKDCAPPTTIDPYTEVIFASTSKSKWVGGTEAEISYDTRGETSGPPSEFRLTWFNGIVTGDRGRYCEAEVLEMTESNRGPTSIGLSNHDADQTPHDTYFIAKDDDDQEENSEVYFTITSQNAAEEHASQFGAGSYIEPRKGSSISAQETVMSGFLNKRRPDGLGFFWQLRYFMLTRSRLSYYKAQADTRAHAQLGQLALKDVIAVQLDRGSSEFVVVVANSQRAPYTLKAETIEDAQRWVDVIEMHAPRIAMMKPGRGDERLGSSVASGALSSDHDGADRSTLRSSHTERDHHGSAEEVVDVPPDTDRDGGGGDSASMRDEDELGDAAGWGGVPRSQDGQDDEGSVSTRLMFASDDGRR
jgi:hypothetical protein